MDRGLRELNSSGLYRKCVESLVEYGSQYQSCANPVKCSSSREARKHREVSGVRVLLFREPRLVQPRGAQSGEGTLAIMEHAAIRARLQGVQSRGKPTG